MGELAKVTIAEVEHASEMNADLRRKLEESTRADAGRIDSVRQSVLASVASESYERAQEDLRGYVQFKANYPAFQVRVERHVEHCCDLIEAIKTKRNFPGMASLSLSKQQELHERVLEHFEELKQNLKHIEKVERDHKLTDVRATVWVLKTACWMVFAVVGVAFVQEITTGQLSSAIDVGAGLLDDASTWVVGYLPFLH